MIYKKILLAFSMLVFLGKLFSQPVPILLNNPSFEDVPMHSKPPAGWYYCGPTLESPPDVHPNGYFNVSHQADDGQTFVGMVTRDNNSWEAIGQRLNSPILANHCYQFSLRAARSDTYESISRTYQQLSTFATPVKIRIWGGNQNCARKELLAESKVIKSIEWKSYSFTFHPKQNCQNLIIEVYYQSPQDAPYNGNLLIDKASPLLPIDCQTHQPLVDIVQLVPPAVNSLPELRKLVTEHGQSIQFAASGLQLQSNFFKDATSETFQLNKHLWTIAQILKIFPNQKLTIAIGGESELEINERKIDIQNTLLQSKLPKKQFKIKVLKKLDRTKTWLWMPENPELLMRLSGK